MPEINYQQFAGNWDPSKASKFGWNNPLSLGSFSLQGSSPENSLDALLKDYSAGYDERFKALQKSLGSDKEGMGSIIAAMNLGQDPRNILFQAKVEQVKAENANKMSQENLRLVEEAAVRQQGRDFTFGQAGNLLSAIPRAFSPMPWDKNQEVVANIANITSPKNITAIPQVSPAGFSYTPTKYFR
jgi:hypothetical protein